MEKLRARNVMWLPEITQQIISRSLTGTQSSSPGFLKEEAEDSLGLNADSVADQLCDFG